LLKEDAVKLGSVQRSKEEIGKIRELWTEHRKCLSTFCDAQPPISEGGMHSLGDIRGFGFQEYKVKGPGRRED
jgi:hypothetical protein